MDSENSDKEQKPWLFKKGQSGNPAGRPKGSKSLKTWAKEYLASLTEEERFEFLEGLPKSEIWKMAEGNPAQEQNISGDIVVNLISYGDNDPAQPEAGQE